MALIERQNKSFHAICQSVKKLAYERKKCYIGRKCLSSFFHIKIIILISMLSVVNIGTRVDNPGEGVAQIFAIIPGGQGFPDKIAREGPLFWVLL